MKAVDIGGNIAFGYFQSLPNAGREIVDPQEIMSAIYATARRTGRVPIHVMNSMGIDATDKVISSKLKECLSDHSASQRKIREAESLAHQERLLEMLKSKL